MGGKANDVEGKHLGFGGDAVKVFFFVLIDVGKVVFTVIYDVFDSEDVVEGEVGSGFAFAVSGSGVIKNTYGFDSCRETIIDYAINVGVEGLEDGDGAFVGCVRFVMEDASSDF